MHRTSNRLEEFKRLNMRTGRWRIAWKNLGASEQRRSYHCAIRAFHNGVRKWHPGTFAEFSAIQAALDRHQSSTEPQRSRRIARPPAIFGSIARTQILQLLATNGPMHVRQLARFRRADSSSTFRAVDRLIEAGVAVKRKMDRRVVSLDRSHRAYTTLKAFLLKLNKSFPVPDLPMPRYRHGLPQARDSHRVPDELALFGQRAQTRALLAVAAAKPLTLTALSVALQTQHTTVWHAVNGLERRGLVVSTRSGRDRIVTLNTRLPAFTELSAYLDALIRTERSEYADIRSLLP